MKLAHLINRVQEQVLRKDKSYCELELEDGNNIYLEKRNGKININCTKSNFVLSNDEVKELTNMISKIK